MQIPTTQSPSLLLPVASERTPVTYGATNPERLPNELTSPIPAAAAAPVRYAVGSAQKPGNAASTPHAQIVTATIASHGSDRYRATGMARPPISAGTATRTVGLAARWVQTTMTTSPITYGIAVIRPCWTVEKFVPYWAANPLMIVGRKNPSA